LSLPCILADRILRPVANGEDGARELRLREREEEVRLILGRVDAAAQTMPSGRSVPIDTRVVTRGDRVGSQRFRALGERGELQIAVAMGARQRCASCGILG